jgi:hypothetical protein
MTETEQLLHDKFGSITLSIKQLAVQLKRTEKSILTDVSSGRFPIPTYKLGKLRVADLRDVAAYLDQKRQEGKDRHEQEKAA